MIHLALAQPLALLLLIPAAAVWWWWLRGHGAWWRAVVLLVLVLAAARPQIINGQGGSDVVLVLDRSGSMGEARDRHEALVRQAGEDRRTGDRLAVVTVGATARVAQGPRHEGVPRLADFDPGDDGSALADGIDAASGLLPPGRSGRIVVVSDGEDTGVSPRAAATALRLRGIPVDVLLERRGGLGDAAVIDIEVPGRLRIGSSFIGAGRIAADRAGPLRWRAVRAATGTAPVVVAEGMVMAVPGRPAAVTFTDRPTSAGVVGYRIELMGNQDRQPGNDAAAAAVAVDGGETVLVIGGDGTPGNVARALAGAGMQVRTRAAGPLSLSDLVGVQVVVLDQVRADRLGATGLAAVAGWVRDLGGGLVMGGGRDSFGQGGYRKSPVEDILPVSLEIRDEHRKLSVAMAIALDRSGSMGAPAGPNRTKMDLADEGAAAAIELLGPHDQVAVLAVDSEPHLVVPMQPAKKSLTAAVLGIQSEGGGIYCYQALVGAGREVMKAEAGTRHIVLFADANDAEEPGDYVNLLAKFKAAGITVSVVGMGTERDSDAQFLMDVAARGGGRISFAAEPADIPRLFAQETVLISRSAWVDARVVPEATAMQRVMLGAADQGAFPAVPGYNLTYPRARAQVLAWCNGDPKAPAAAAWTIGAGRSVALPIALDDAASPGLPAWSGYGRWLASCVRFAAGREASVPAMLTAHRVGRDVTWRLELEPGRRMTTAPVLAVLGEDGSRRALALVPVAEDVWEADDRIASERVQWPAALVDVGDGDQAVLGPPIRLPCPVEAEPRFGRESGEQVATVVARDGGGTVRADLVGIFTNPPSPGDPTELAIWLVAAGLALAVIEIAVRRLRLVLPAVRWPRRRASAVPAAQRDAAPTGQQPRATASPASSGVSPASSSASAPSAPSPSVSPPAGGGLSEALKKARRR